MFRLNDQSYGMFITEEVGASSGTTLTFMRDAILENFALGAGIAAEDVVVYDVEETEVAGHAAETVIYGGAINGLDVVFLNTLTIGEVRTVQTVTYYLRKSLEDADRATHQGFLALTKLD
ncbi:hypothetical protein CLV88_112138 [Shimia abyssi]|uniref:Uncharacterized protein n=2 Tax=Shimia abyssi TaxID=1662395 RepID=A0A2P8F915_9RHOB|nr:hypothetical protein CLV88_112138 [Shimia abyssi]